MPNRIQNLQSLAASVKEKHHHIEVESLLGVSFKIAVNEQEYPWHQHPNSDELFIMFDGELEIEYESGEKVRLKKDDTLLINAGVVHRTRPIGRAVNLLIERDNIETIFVDSPK